MKVFRCLISLISYSILLAMITGLSAGCAKRQGVVIRELRESPSCCTSLAGLPTEPLKMGQAPRTFDIGQGTPAYQFDTGKSYFRAFVLPDTLSPYRLKVDSYLVGGYLKTAYLFAPQLVTLDKDFKVVRATTQEDFTVAQAGLVEALQQAGGLDQKLSGKVDFKRANANERYLVVRTTDALLGARTVVPVRIGASLIAFGGANVAREEVAVPHAPAGRISVALLPIADSAPIPAAAAPMPAGMLPAATVELPKKTQPAAQILDAATTVTVRLINGNKVGTFELGETDASAARRALKRVGVEMGAEHVTATAVRLGSALLPFKRYYAPPGTPHLIYFDDNDRLVLFVDLSPVGMPATGGEFIRHFVGAAESGRTPTSYELQAVLAPCVSIIATYSTSSDSLDSVAYGFSCITK